MSAQIQTQWEQCLQVFSDNLQNEEAYNAFFAPLRPLSYENNRLVLAVPSPFVYEQLEGQYFELLKSTLQHNYGKDVILDYKVDLLKTIDTEDSSTHTESQTPEFETHLNPNCTFSNFFTGESNRVAINIANSVTVNPGHSAFNPYFIFGKSGVGKTHLAQAIGHKIIELNPNSKVLYVPSHTFQVQYVDAVRQNKVPDFINYYQNIDVLIVDDIQEFAGKNKVATQNTFFHIFNHLHQLGKQLIMTCDRPPVELEEDLVPRLLTRFKWGFTGEIEQPDYELRREILQSKCKKEGLNISQDVIDYIASKATDNVRDLEGIINSLLAHSIAFNRPVDIDLASRVMRMIVKIADRKVITCEHIIHVVQNVFGIDIKTFNSKTRKREVVLARQAAMHLCKKHTQQSVSRIGSLVGGRDHATVLHALKSVDDLLSTDQTFKDKYLKAEAQLNEQ